MEVKPDNGIISDTVNRSVHVMKKGALVDALPSLLAAQNRPLRLGCFRATGSIFRNDSTDNLLFILLSPRYPISNYTLKTKYVKNKIKT